MAISSFIPTVWSETLLNELNREYIGVRNCSRDFEGDIKGKGSSVKIGGVGAVSVFDYTKDTDMNSPESLSDSVTTLTIDQAKAFNFQIDDIDRIQSQPKLMTAAMRQAAAALADEADRYVYRLYKDVDVDNVECYNDITVEDIVDIMVKTREMLLSNGVNSNIETCFEVTPQIATLLLKTKILNGTDNTDTFENGMLGRMLGFDVYVSPNVFIDAEGRHKCIARTKRAIAFAEQLNEVEAYRPESRFADAVKGLHLYGAKIVYPKEIFVVDCLIYE